jgi:hypothetical protein
MYKFIFSWFGVHSGLDSWFGALMVKPMGLTGTLSADYAKRVL